MPIRIDPEVKDVLATAACEGTTVRLPGQLDRAMYTRVDRVLKAAGGKWDRKAGGHVFTGGRASVILRQLLDGDQVISKVQARQFFPTPGPIVDTLIAAAMLEPHHKVLEPSAGQGAIASRVAPLVAAVDCIEIDDEYAAVIRAAGYARQLTVGDFLTTPENATYDRVIMNPPFTRGTDIKHVRRALWWLKPGGCLVSVMAAGVTFRTDHAHESFRVLVDMAGGWIDPLPGDAFRESGTEVGTVLVMIPKPAREQAEPAPEAGQLTLFGAPAC